MLRVSGQGLVRWILFLVEHNLGGMFACAIERSWPAFTWTIALAAVLLAAPPLPVVWLSAALFAANGVALALLGLPHPSDPLPRHPVSFGILGLSFPAPGTFLPLHALRATPLPSLTMGVP